MNTKTTKRNSRLSALIAVIVILMTLSACGDNRVYDHYEHATVGGWEKNDALAFDIPALAESGRYTLSLGIRTNDAIRSRTSVLSWSRHPFLQKRRQWMW